MKKLALILAAMLVALPLASCNAEDTSDPTTTASTTTTTTTTTTAATTTKNPILDKLPETEEKPDNPDNPGTPEVSKDVKIGTAEELIETFRKINSGEMAEDSNITLTANIDLSACKGVADYEPLYYFSGTFDGAGHAIFNLNWKFIMKNGGGNMPNATDVGSYVLEDLPDGTAGRFARGTVALLILKLDGGTVKNLTLADSSLTIECSYNKNYQMYFGGVVGYMSGGTVADVTLSNVDVTIPANVNYNQGFTGYAAPVAGRVSGSAAITDCIVGSGCTVDASDNVMFNTGTLAGVLEAGGMLNIEGSSSEAECKVHLSPTKDVLAYKGEGIVLGGVAGGLIGTDLNN